MKTAVARRYAKALFELLDRQAVESARTALDGLGQAFLESAELRHALAFPAFSEVEKLGVLTHLADRLGGPPTVKIFLDQLVKKNRVGFLPEIAEAFGKLVDASKGTEQVRVSSGLALPQVEQDRVRARLREVLQRDVDTTFETIPAHIAGLQIRLGSTVVDSTIRGRLTAMQRLLTKE